MKSISKACLIAAFLYAPIVVFAQKDSAWLACPFEHGIGKEAKEAYKLDPPEKKIIMISQVDTLVRSAVTGTVSNVSMAEDNKYEIVIHYKNFYFWYFGITQPLVKIGQKVGARQAIGTYTIGAELEFRMFKHEEPMDSRNLLECKVPGAKD